MPFTANWLSPWHAAGDDGPGRLGWRDLGASFDYASALNEFLVLSNIDSMRDSDRMLT